MKLIARLILVMILTYFLSFYMPWWIVFVVTFLTGFIIHGSGINVFIGTFLGAGLVWMLYAWYLDYNTASILSQKVIQLFPFDDPMMLIITSGLVGGLCGGFGGLSGNSFRQLFLKKKQKSFYS
ncbi:hypothetical protein [Marinoscillum furvescens]|uniref:Uncharacterized protein n=1 Tax=Marinoscillum furvescens DSM 4134 TaxID=1122208 RepID=A0A3D9L1S3_MARFU|nr:hypothetical protein [Marinoscillum furvescens]RED97539.1 hypothetical protein C7460_112150 [Marinoscillum furvescens DSM 4134]